MTNCMAFPDNSTLTFSPPCVIMAQDIGVLSPFVPMRQLLRKYLKRFKEVILWKE